MKKLISPTTLYLLAPLPAIAIGAIAGYHHAAPATAFLWNAVAALAGIALNLFFTKNPFDRSPTPKSPHDKTNSAPTTVAIAITIAVLVLSITLISPGLEGVKRYLPIGRLIVNPSAILCPFFLFAIHFFLNCRPRIAGILSLLISAIHFVQPDAGQATAFVIGTIVLFLFQASGQRLLKSSVVLLTTGISLLTWHQPDPLPAVPHVERIFHLISEDGWTYVLCAITAYLILLLPLLTRLQYVLRIRGSSSIHDHQTVSFLAAMIAYFLTTFVVTELGNFPVPIFGGGASPILGYYLMLFLIHKGEP